MTCTDDGNECTTESCDASLGCQSSAVASETGNTCGSCGDNILNSGEECDDSPPEGYTCNDNCRLEADESVCVPEKEICDKIDNDCDGTVDEEGCESEETECLPEEEICDGIDNDCDGAIDEEGCEEDEPAIEAEPASTGGSEGGSEIPDPDDQETAQCVEKNGQMVSLDDLDIPLETLWGIREGTITTFNDMDVVYDWDEGEVVAIGVCDTDSVPASLVFKGSGGIGGCSLNRN